jgi:hypothetical protein
MGEIAAGGRDRNLRICFRYWIRRIAEIDPPDPLRRRPIGSCCDALGSSATANPAAPRLAADSRTKATYLTFNGCRGRDTATERPNQNGCAPSVAKSELCGDIVSRRGKNDRRLASRRITASGITRRKSLSYGPFEQLRLNGRLQISVDRIALGFQLTRTQRILRWLRFSASHALIIGGDNDYRPPPLQSATVFRSDRR